MKKMIMVLTMVSVMALGLGNALAFDSYNTVTGPLPQDMTRSYDNGVAVSGLTPYNTVVGLIPQEMTQAYENGTSVRPHVSFNSVTGPVTDQDWALMWDHAATGTAY